MKELLPKFRLNAGRLSLRNQLALVFSSIALLLALTLVAVTEKVVRPDLEQNQGLFLAELAYQTAEKLDHGMFERYREIQIFATLNRFRNLDTDVISQRSLLDTIQSTHTDYAWIGFIDQSGIVRASTQQILEGTNISQRPVFMNAQGQPWVGDVHEAVLLAKFLPNPSNEPLRFVDVAVPVMDDQGQQIGVLAAHLYWEWARRIEISLSNTSNSFQNYSEVETFIISQDHQIVLAPQSELKEALTQDVILNAARQNGAGYLLDTNRDDAGYLTAYAQTKGYQTYPGLGWTVLLRQPTTTAFRAARQLQQENLKLSLAFGFSLLCLGWILARQIADPILKMAIATEQFRRGNRNVLLPTLKGDSEVALLTRSFKKLLRELTDRERDLIALNGSLEDRVEERTNELTRLNAALQLEAAEHMETERKLQELTVVLQHSNRELEQFAYVASHDLQEPLRAVASYTQLLERKYRGTLDEKAEKYIHYIVDGASRMQQLINDLLTYSRVGRQSLDLELIDCNQIVTRVIKTLKVAIAESHATVTHDQLPSLVADSSKLTQLFQNLIGNAIKYHGDAPPVVHISGHLQENSWQFTVQDNGIGIDPQFADRIFVIFQRLHTRRYYSGTGIGLAICKKIVELHRGCIWVESQPNQGSTFYFTLASLDTTHDTTLEESGDSSSR